MTNTGAILKSLAVGLFAALIIFGGGIFAPKKAGDIYRTTASSVLYVLEPIGQRGGGTGFVIETENGNKFTITNAHVCEMSRVGYMAVLSDTAALPVRLPILAVWPAADLCVLAPMPNTPALSLASGANIRESIHIVGHPLLMPTTISSGYFTGTQVIDIMSQPDGETGECADMSEGYRPRGYPAVQMDERDPLQSIGFCVKRQVAQSSDARAYPGNSGSPVVNDYGDVVGVLFAGNNENFAFIVPLIFLQELLKGY